MKGFIEDIDYIEIENKDFCHAKFGMAEIENKDFCTTKFSRVKI